MERTSKQKPPPRGGRGGWPAAGTAPPPPPHPPPGAPADLGKELLAAESAGQLAYLKKAMSFIAWGQAKYAAARRPDGASSGD